MGKRVFTVWAEMEDDETGRKRLEIYDQVDWMPKVAAVAYTRIVAETLDTNVYLEETEKSEPDTKVNLDELMNEFFQCHSVIRGP